MNSYIDNNKKISVCIPVFNAEKTIEKLVNEICIILKNYKFEIILVNDCSQDNSDKICSNLAILNKYFDIN